MWLRHRALAAATTTTATTAGAVALQQPRRAVTSRGQFNPVHNFDVALRATGRRARDAREFEAMLANPGPVRVTYSPDYLDWLYRAYKAKLRYTDARAKAERIFGSQMLTQPYAQTSSSGSGGADEEQLLPGAPPPGYFMRPPHSQRRCAAEAQRAAAQHTLDETARQQGMLDVFERQPQFPALHLDRATRWHIVELFKELVLHKYMDSDTLLWDRALLYRAILSERRASYPGSFAYIFDAVDATVLARDADSGNTSSAQHRGGGGGDGADAQRIAQRCPRLRDYAYFVYLVRRYHVDNAVEGHVVLRCHRERNAQQLLFSNPPPRDDAEVRRSVRALLLEQRDGAAATTATSSSSSDSSSGAVMSGEQRKATSSQQQQRQHDMPPLRAPTAYPPLEALWRCEENVPLLRVLVFGELNLIVSQNPFVKFTHAQAFLTRPYASEGSVLQLSSGQNNNSSSSSSSSARGGGGGGASFARRDGDAASLASIIAEQRSPLLAPLARNFALAIDGRAHDVARLQQRHHREDVVGFARLMRSSGGGSGSDDAEAVMYASYADWAYFNPRAVRAEQRDALELRALAAMKCYDAAGRDMYRSSYDDIVSNNAARAYEQPHTLAQHIPTLPHFVAVVQKDAHVAFLLHVALPSAQATTATTTTATTAAAARVTTADEDTAHVHTHEELERLVLQLAKALHHTALDYHKEQLRRVHRQKVNIAAALLDRFVALAWRRVLAVHTADTRSRSVAAVGDDEVRRMAERLGTYRPFEMRALDEHGFTTSARADDYARWMAPPSTG